MPAISSRATPVMLEERVAEWQDSVVGLIDSPIWPNEICGFVIVLHGLERQSRAPRRLRWLAVIADPVSDSSNSL